MDILRLLEELQQQVLEKPKRLGPLWWGIDEDEISMQISKIRASLPTELKAAVATVRESERIVEGAREDATLALENAQKEGERVLVESRREAERIVEQAKLQQERMVAESEILKLSKAQSEEIRSAADREAHQMRRGAEKYAYDVLVQLENVVGKVMTTIDRGKQEVRPVETPAQTAARDKARV